MRVSLAYCGASASLNFKLALPSDVRGSDEPTFILYHNPSGLYAAVDGGSKVLRENFPQIGEEHFLWEGAIA